MSEINDYELDHKEFIILGLVSEDPSGSHAYSINKRIEERGMRNWTNIGKSSIYRIINDLEKSGLVSSFEEEHDNRKRRIYRITDNGSRILKEKVYNALNEFNSHSDENFYVAFSMLPVLTVEEQIETMSNSIELNKVAKKDLEDMVSQIPHMPLNVRGLFIHPIKLIQVNIEFLEESLEEIKKGGKIVDPETFGK